MRQADVLGLPIGDQMARRGGGETTHGRTRSDLEEDFLKLCERHRLPRPRVNVPIGPHLVDFLWPRRKLVVETDSYLYHRGRVAFQDDRDRDLDLKRRGFTVLRLSERQVNEQEGLVAEALSAALRSGDGRENRGLDG